MNISGKSLKHKLTVKELLKPLRQPQKRHDKKADEQYLKETFHL
jgi:hypothetical protein